LGAPLFNNLTMNLENGKQIVINAPTNSAANKYISSLSLNGKPWDNNWLSHTDLMKGAMLDFGMRAASNEKRGTKESAAPYSLSDVK